MRQRTILILLLCLQSCILAGQNQLVLLHREKVLARYGYGDDFRYKLKKSGNYTSTFITDVREFSVVTFNDTVAYADIDRVSLRGHPQKRFSLISKFLITAGILYFTLDQVNNVLVQGNKADMEPTVWKPSLVMVGTGYALKLFRKRTQRIRFPARLLSAERGSRFYKSDDQ